jgi:hypothetical protein
VCGLGAGEFYVACFTWAMLVVTGSGGTDLFPTATSVGENLLVTALNLVAAFFWTTVRRPPPRSQHRAPCSTGCIMWVS